MAISDKRLSWGKNGRFFSGIDLVKSILSRADLAKHEAARRKEKEKPDERHAEDVGVSIEKVSRARREERRTAFGAEEIFARLNVQSEYTRVCVCVCVCICARAKRTPMG